jgi:phosphatidate cytidylyltransferase
VLRTRVLVAIVLIPLVVGFLYLGGLPWLLGVLLAGVLAWLEMAGILRREQYRADRNLGLFFVVGAVVDAYLHSTFPGQYDLVRPLLVALILFSLIWALCNKGEHPTADWGMTVAGALYLGVTISYLVALRQRPNGFYWAVTAFVVTWACDAMAYFAGRAFGKHKLWPRISPKKTWEGIAGGTLGAIIAGLALGVWLLGIPWGQGVLLGALVAVVAPFGDLAESLFKRQANVKDSSQLIPGHGGVLDRIDSLLFVFPVITYFAFLVKGP